MLQYEIAKKLYDEMEEKAAKQSEEFREFYQEFLKDAAEYAKTRLSWSFMTLVAKGTYNKSKIIVCKRPDRRGFSYNTVEDMAKTISDNI